MDQDPHHIELRAAGWPGPIGWSTPPKLRTVVAELDDKELVWTCIELDAVKLSRSSVLLFAQGMRLSYLFPADLTFFDRDVATGYANPILLLKATPPNLLEVSPKLRGVVLGVVLSTKGLEESEIRGEMLSHVLKT